MNAPPDSHAIWERLGGSGDPPSLLGKHKGALLILGGAACVWDDFAKVRPRPLTIMAVNDVGQHVHDAVAHWASLHPAYAWDGSATATAICTATRRPP